MDLNKLCKRIEFFCKCAQNSLFIIIIIIITDNSRTQKRLRPTRLAALLAMLQRRIRHQGFFTGTQVYA